jgi:hypothetical protein
MPQALVKNEQEYQDKLKAIKEKYNCDIYYYERSIPKSYPVVMIYFCREIVNISRFYDTNLSIDFVYRDSFLED